MLTSPLLASFSVRQPAALASGGGVVQDKRCTQRVAVLTSSKAPGPLWS
eukprot:SAG31_NODE_19665_length_595_cov_0.856855_1_plen_48_part_10